MNGGLIYFAPAFRALVFMSPSARPLRLRPWLHRPALAALLLAALLAGCGPRGPGDFTPFLDLIQQLPLAEVRHETGLVDLGTPAGRSHLRKGWSWDEAGDRQETFAWSDGEESEIDFFVAEPRDLPVTFRGSPYFFLDEPAQEVTFRVNGREAGKATLARGWSENRLVLPASALREGDNRLVLRYAYTRVPRDLTAGMSPDTRRLGVLWDYFRFDTRGDPAARVRATGRQLYIPYGVSVEYYTRFPVTGALLAERVQSRGEEGGSLAVTVSDEKGEESAGRLSPGTEPAALRLPLTGKPVRVSLTAIPAKRPAPTASGIVLTRPAFGLERGAVVSMPGGASGTRAAEAAVAARNSGRRPPNVIVYLVDTLRADHLGCYGYGKPVSPHADAFAKEATLFESVVAQAPWTRPAVASILTGVWPKTHGVNGRQDALSHQALTLAEMLQSRGYHTAGFATNGNVAKAFGFAQGFDTYELLPRSRQASRFVTERAARWLDENPDRPFFLYLHTVDPHSPYRPEPEFRARFAPAVPNDGTGGHPWLGRLQHGSLRATRTEIDNALALYDAEIAQNDASFGALIELLRKRGLWDNTAVVFLSDHGEEFHDHGGWEHGKTLYSEMLHVPLIVRLPGLGEGRRIGEVAQQIDLVPTLLAWLGMPLPPHLEGRDLLPLLLRSEGDEPPPPSVETVAYSYMDVDGHRGTSATAQDWHLIDVRAPAPRVGLFDRKEDPAERDNRAGKSPVGLGYMRALLAAKEREKRQTLRPGEGVMDDELREQLKALGYIH